MLGFSFRRRIGYDSDILSQKRWKNKVDKAYCCPDCNIMTGKVQRCGDNFVSTCERCGLIWETK